MSLLYGASSDRAYPLSPRRAPAAHLRAPDLKRAGRGGNARIIDPVLFCGAGGRREHTLSGVCARAGASALYERGLASVVSAELDLRNKTAQPSTPRAAHRAAAAPVEKGPHGA